MKFNSNFVNEIKKDEFQNNLLIFLIINKLLDQQNYTLPHS